MIKKKVLVFTSSRSEFEMLEGVILSLKELATVELLISGSHTLSTGRSSLAHAQNFCLNHSIQSHTVPFDLPDQEDGYSQAISNSTASRSFANLLLQRKPDLIIIIGDRWELFALSIPALLMRIPIAHISGGESTIGAVDDSIRHAHTKLSSLHFVACREYARVVSVLGEEDWRIVVSGESGLDWLHAAQLPSPEEVRQRFGLKRHSPQPLLLLTYHPTSYGDRALLLSELAALTQALEELKSYEILITGPGLEQGSDTVRECMLHASSSLSNVHYVEHLGRVNYLTLMRTAAAVIGNSSSGIVEAPSVGIPSLDIGDRQKGRLRAESVHHCSFSSSEIVKMINHIASEGIRRDSSHVLNPYDPYQDGKNSLRIAAGCMQALETVGTRRLLAKEFHQDCDPTQWDTLLQ